MANRSSNHEEANTRPDWRKRKGLIARITTAVVAVLALYGLPELNYQHDISAMKDGIEKARTDVATPAGAVEQSPPALTQGAHFFDKIACVDVNCPQVESTWLVPLASDTIAQFKSSVTQKIKAKAAGDLFVDRNKWEVDLFDSPSSKAPYPAPDGKKWLAVHIFVHE